MGIEQACAGRDGQTRLTRQNSQAQRGHEQDRRRYLVDPYSPTLLVMTINTYMRTSPLGRINAWYRMTRMTGPNCAVMCVCVFSSHSFWTSSSLAVPAGVTQEEGHTGFFIHLLSAVRTLIFLARRIHPFLSLVDREVEFCLLTI